LRGSERAIVPRSRDQHEASRRRRRQASRRAEQGRQRSAVENRAAPDHASTSFKCDGDDADAGAAAKPEPKTDPKAALRFCTAKRQAGAHSLEVRYWEADKSIVGFWTRPALPATCDDLGANQVVKSWDVPAKGGQSVKRTLCSLTSGPLSGMQAVVNAAANAPVYVFSPSYLDKDPAMKKLAGG
jgi:hypothetical protein